MIGIISSVGICFIVILEFLIAINENSTSKNDVSLERETSSPNLQVQQEKPVSSYNFDWFSKAVVKSSKVASQTMMIFVCCIITNGIITDVIKVTVGSLRPNFLSVCNPNISCTLQEENQFNLNYFCQNSNRSDENQARQSFPSGHASMASTSMIFLIFYVHRRSKQMQKHVPIFLKWTISLCLFSLAIWISMTRVSDYHHHLIDVLFGIVLGAFIGVIGSVHSTTSCERNKEKEQSEKLYTIGLRSQNTNQFYKNDAFNEEDK